MSESNFLDDVVDPVADPVAVYGTDVLVAEDDAIGLRF